MHYNDHIARIENAPTLRHIGFRLAQSLESGDLNKKQADDLATFALDKFRELSARIIIDKYGTNHASEESEIFYTGGGIWCGVIPLGFGLWFTGELNDHGAIYKAKKTPEDMDLGDSSDPDFVRYTTDEDTEQVIDLWKKAIEHERTNVHGLACYCDEWQEENDICREQGTTEYILNDED